MPTSLYETSRAGEAGPSTAAFLRIVAAERLEDHAVAGCSLAELGEQRPRHPPPSALVPRSLAVLDAGRRPLAEVAPG